MCQHAIVDHLSLAQYVGFVGGSFHEVQHIRRNLQVQWATAFRNALRMVMEALRALHPNESRGELDLERVVKWKFLLLLLLLRKPLSTNSTKAKDLRTKCSSTIGSIHRG